MLNVTITEKAQKPAFWGLSVRGTGVSGNSFNSAARGVMIVAACPLEASENEEARLNPIPKVLGSFYA